jgi:DNA-binding IclR family transcriptional regulator
LKNLDPFEVYTYDGKEGSYCGRQLTAAELKARYEHPLTKERTAWTRMISDVTHEELAQFVLDGTPIKREQEIPKAKVIFAPVHHAGIKASMNIKTPLKGEINV